MRASELKEKKPAEVQHFIETKREELAKFHRSKRVDEIKDLTQARKLRRDLARALTVQRQVQKEQTK